MHELMLIELDAGEIVVNGGHQLGIQDSNIEQCSEPEHSSEQWMRRRRQWLGSLSSEYYNQPTNYILNPLTYFFLAVPWNKIIFLDEAIIMWS